MLPIPGMETLPAAYLSAAVYTLSSRARLKQRLILGFVNLAMLWGLGWPSSTPPFRGRQDKIISRNEALSHTWNLAASWPEPQPDPGERKQTSTVPGGPCLEALGALPDISAQTIITRAMWAK